MILSKLISDVELRCYSGTISDDAELSKTQVLHWLLITRDQLVRDYLNLVIQNGKPIPTEYQIREVHEAAAEDLSDTEEEDERIYLTLDYQPMSLLNDLGVQRVLSQDGVQVLRTRSENADWIKDLKWGKPSVKAPVFYRDSRKIILEGASYKNPKPWIVYYIPTATSQELEMEDDLVISDELLPDLLMRVSEMARQEMYGSVADNENNGKDDIKPQ
jgi:hypothetical protein